MYIRVYVHVTRRWLLETRSTEIQTNHFPPSSLHSSSSSQQTHPSPHIWNTPSSSPLAGSLELGSSAPNATNFFSGGSHNNHQAAVHARVWTPVGTGFSTPRDGAIMARPKLAGRQRRLTGHKYLGNKLSHRDVSSCRVFLWRKGLSPLHATGVISGEYLLAAEMEVPHSTGSVFLGLLIPSCSWLISILTCQIFTTVGCHGVDPHSPPYSSSRYPGAEISPSSSWLTTHHWFVNQCSFQFSL